MIEQKGMPFDHDFGHFFPLFSSLLKKEGRRKGELIAKIGIKSHAFLLDLIQRHKLPLSRLYLNIRINVLYNVTKIFKDMFSFTTLISFNIYKYLK